MKVDGKRNVPHKERIMVYQYPVFMHGSKSQGIRPDTVAVDDDGSFKAIPRQVNERHKVPPSLGVWRELARRVLAGIPHLQNQANIQRPGPFYDIMFSLDKLHDNTRCLVIFLLGFGRIRRSENRENGWMPHIVGILGRIA